MFDEQCRYASLFSVKWKLVTEKNPFSVFTYVTNMSNIVLTQVEGKTLKVRYLLSFKLASLMSVLSCYLDIL